MLRIPRLEEPELLADWMEASLLSQAGTDRVSDADILDRLEMGGYESEEGLERILQQFRHRLRVMGDRYPIERDGQGFRPRGTWESSLCYSFLLFVSLNQGYRELKFREGTARAPALLFELLTARALELFLHGRAIRIGAPRHAPVPGNFELAVDYLAAEIKEPVGQRDMERHTSGDDGLDIWLVKGFEDERPSQVFVIAQCAIGEDWGEKRSELDVGLWKRHIDWFTEPLKAFAVPFQIAQASWRETASRGGLVLDRPRIAKAVDASDLPGPVAKKMRSWTKTRIAAAASLVAS